VTDQDPLTEEAEATPAFDQPTHQNGDFGDDDGDFQDVVRADHVEISQGGAQSIEATTVSLTQGGAGRIQADEVSIHQGGAGLVQTDNLHLQEGSSAFAVLAGEANINEGANVFILFARSVSGEVRPVLDWRAAAALGAGFGVAVALFRRRA
jgi:hypothetical protein